MGNNKAIAGRTDGLKIKGGEFSTRNRNTTAILRWLGRCPPECRRCTWSGVSVYTRREEKDQVDDAASVGAVVEESGNYAVCSRAPPPPLLLLSFCGIRF